MIEAGLPVFGRGNQFIPSKLLCSQAFRVANILPPEEGTLVLVPRSHFSPQEWRGSDGGMVLTVQEDDIVNRSSEVLGASGVRQGLSALLCLSLCLTAFPEVLSAMQDASTSTTSMSPEYATKTPAQLQQLVAPIALYPDALEAQVFSASTFPEQVVEADRWIQAHPDLKGDALAKAVDEQSWDPSVKALTAFPSVLGNMDKNLSWTSSLGEAYYNQQADLMAAVQVMRQKAEQAGNLKTTRQQVVKTENETIIIEPADPEVVYVPAYDPWVVYGYPVLVAWPGWYAYPGIWYSGTYVSFRVWYGVGFYYGYGWGWHHWGCDWHHHWVEHNHYRYNSRSRTFYNRNTHYRSDRDGWHSFSREGTRRSTRSYGGRVNAYSHSGRSANSYQGHTRAARGYVHSSGERNTRTGIVSNFNHGGEQRTYSPRGRSSFGGGGLHGGGGGPHR